LKYKKGSISSESSKEPTRLTAEQSSPEENAELSQTSSSPSDLPTGQTNWSGFSTTVSPKGEYYNIEQMQPNTSINEYSDLSGGSYVVLEDSIDQYEQIPPSGPVDSFYMVNSHPNSYQQPPMPLFEGYPGPVYPQPTSYQSDNDLSRLYSRPKRALMAPDHNNESDDPNDEGISGPDFIFNLSPKSLPEKIARSVNHNYIANNLMKIYHDSMENALSCWLNERTCPYRYAPKAIMSSEDATKQSLKEAWSDDWPNRIFQRVQGLDRVSGRFRDKPLSKRESDAASKALYYVIMAFASQWAQSSQRSREEHPSAFGNGQSGKGYAQTNSTSDTPDMNGREEFDRVLQQAYWYEARKALVDCADVESFVVAFANIVFSLTQKPMSEEQKEEIRRDSNATTSTLNFADGDLDGLHDRVFRVIDEDGPPIYLEQGVRHAHSLRHKLQRREREMAKQTPGVDPTRTILGEEERTTVDLMAWLGYMLESLTSAMHQRPLVVADEDTDVLPDAIAALKLTDDETSTVPRPDKDGANSRLWNDYFFLQEQHNRHGVPLRYQCSYEEQAAGLTDAAPIKVLLYRKITHLQSLVSRFASPTKIEDAIQAAIMVYDHWITHYEPFIKDCIAHHDELNLRIQSWYICLTGHFHLAALLLADSIESIDNANSSQPTKRADRIQTRCVANLRAHNAQMVSDLARCSTPRSDNSFSQSPSFHHAVKAGALLTEPWTALLIRVFAKAAVLLLTTASTLTAPSDKAEADDLLRRADDCIRALKYLGRKSDTARLAGDTLDAALRSAHQRRRDSEELAAAEQRAWNERAVGLAAAGQEEWLGLGSDLGEEFEFLPEQAPGATVVENGVDGLVWNW
jgi:hypothetical protein